jgi:hypothetical protein
VGVHRVEGTRVLGLYCILYGQLQVSLDDVSTLAGFISKGAIPVRVMACRALCDLALFRGGAVRVGCLGPLRSCLYFDPLFSLFH